MKSVRGALLDLRTVCAASEENYRAILSHLGSEVEIAARYVRFLIKLNLTLADHINRLTDVTDFRLMSAYLDADIGGGKMQLSGPVTVRGRPTMLAWFEDVQVGISIGFNRSILWIAYFSLKGCE